MSRVKNLLVLLWCIFKNLPFVVLFSLFTPFVSGAITVYIYTAQAELINIMIKSLHMGTFGMLLKEAVLPLSIYLFVSITQLFLEFLQKISSAMLNAKATNLIQSEIINICNDIDFVELCSSEFCNKLQRANSALGDDFIVIINSLTQSITIFSTIISLILMALKYHYSLVAVVVSVMILINQCHLVKTSSIYFFAVRTLRTAIYISHKTIEILHFPQTWTHNSKIHL